MALIHCSECKDKISDKAKVCVYCGYHLNPDDVKGVHVFLSINDVQKILGCGQNTVYDLVNQRDFPKIRIGKRNYIPREEFLRWVSTYLRKKYKIC